MRSTCEMNWRSTKEGPSLRDTSHGPRLEASADSTLSRHASKPWEGGGWVEMGAKRRQ
jgi:hypothetical protein